MTRPYIEKDARIGVDKPTPSAPTQAPQDTHETAGTGGAIPSMAEAEAPGWHAPLPFHETTGPDFPIDIFTEPIARFAEAQTETLQVPAGLIGTLALGVGAAACAGRATISPSPGWSEPLNEYYLVALPSGERKSEGFKQMVAPIEERERELAETARPEIDQARVERDISESRLKGLKTRAGNAKPEDTEQPRREAITLSLELEGTPIRKIPRLMADDATPEAVATLLSEQGGRMAIMSTEGGLFVTMGGRYSEGVPNLDIFTKAYTGDPVRVDRKNRDPEYIPNACLTLCLTVQPQVIQDLSVHREFRGRGLLARFKYSIPESKVGYRMTDVVPVEEHLRAEWNAIIKGILRLPYPQDPNEHRIRLSPEADRLFREYRESVEMRLRPGAELHDIADWGNRLPGTVARHAGILHMMTHARDSDSYPWDKSVSKVTMERAIAIGDHFTAHAHVAFGLMGADPLIETARCTWDYIDFNGYSRFSQRDLWQSIRRRFTRVSELSKVLLVLAEMGYICPVRVDSPEGRGRKPSPEYDVNPIARTQNSLGTQRTYTL